MKKGVLIGVFFCFLSLLLVIYVHATNSGSATVPVSTIDLNDENSEYNMKPGRLKFEFDDKLYAIQLRRVKQDYAWFLIMDLDESKQDDITAYTIEESFNLTTGENKMIDLDKDGIYDIVLNLDNTGKIDNIKSASFSIKRLGKEELESDINESEVSDHNTSLDEIEENIELNDNSSETINVDELEANGTEESISESVIVLNNKSIKQKGFREKIINFVKDLFE